MKFPEESDLLRMFDAFVLSPRHRDDITAYLRILRNRDEVTFLHSVRVGLLAERIAEIANSPGVAPKMLLWAGLLHDIGKALIPPDLLAKKEEFSQDDYAAMEPHVKYGWDLLNQIHDYTAHIVIRHHQFGPRPYPAALPPLPAYLNEETVTEAARLLALADYYDALMHRENDKFGNAPLTSQQKREKFLLDNADKAELVALLEKLGILDFSTP
jgi:putative nucleotidyltransferase with HDIG domain